MHPAAKAACVAPETALKDVIIAMTRRPLGAACVVTAGGRLAGILTGGDLRRALTSHDNIRGLRACDAMTARPVTIGPDATLGHTARADGTVRVADLGAAGGGRGRQRSEFYDCMMSSARGSARSTAVRNWSSVNSAWRKWTE